MKHLFFGGIHPKDKKKLSADNTRLGAVKPGQVVIPMVQHIGAPCQPLVSVGDKVKLGQKIGDGEGLCVPVHASVSGTVAAVELRPHTSGRDILAVVIDNDGLDTPVSAAENNTPLEELDSDSILSAIREAGIVGMGGAAFPGNVKALSAMGHVDTLIANGCECEPYITADDFLLRTEPEQVLQGMQLLHKVLQPERMVLAVEDNKAQAIETVKNILTNYPQVELKVLPTRYPQGAEKQLIRAVTGRQVRPGKLPVSVGCAVFNVSTYAAIYRAVRLGQPLTHRIVTVSGETVAQPGNFRVPIGTSFRELLDAAGGIGENTERVISGGPMMGVPQKHLDVPVVKATNSVLCLPMDINGAAVNPVCLRCGKCVSVCPMRLQPLYLYRYAKCEDTAQLKRLHLTDCMECGSCAYTCPGKLPLVERIREGKALLRQEKEEKK